MASKKNFITYKFPAPIDNDILVGHMSTVQSFMDAWATRDVHPIHPVWLLSGPRGIGKATLAYKIAKMVYGNVGDFFIIDLAHNIDEKGNPKISGQITVHTIREMILSMQMSSMSGKWRVVLIDSVDELTNNAANAMLKLLEEPPANTLFLLITHKLSNVLPTIRSRSRIEKMHTLTLSELRDLCIKFIPNEEINTDILKLVNGSFGKIADLKRSGGDIIYNNFIKVLSNPKSELSDMLELSKKLSGYPELYTILLDVVAHFKLADLYPFVNETINDLNRLHLEPETAIFKIVTEIKKCL